MSNIDPHTFATSYEFRGECGDYTPTEAERAMIEDAISSYLAEVENGDLPQTPWPASGWALDRIRDLEAEVGRLRQAADYISPYLRWTISSESPGYAPAMPSAVAAFHVAFDIDTDAKRAARIGKGFHPSTCEHDWFDCSNAASPPPAKSCRKCGWTCGDDETHGVFVAWPWLQQRQTTADNNGGDRG